MIHELLVQRKLRLRRKFKQIVRQVIMNSFWLLDTEDEQIGENVRKNITLIIKRNESSLLSLKEKSILRKQVELRTEEENNCLYRSIGNLKCFRKWPDDVKYKLVSSTYFLYFEEGRTIVKQNRFAEGLYFIISGEVNVLIEYVDEITGEFVVKQVNKLGQGSMFGEISLLKNIPRTATIVTATDCEFIMVSRKNFEDILHSTLKKQWDEIKLGLSYFPYFRTLNDNSQTECCLISFINEYKRNEIIFDPTKKLTQKTAWFILEGSCRMIELIFVEEITKKHSKSYRLYEKEISKVHKIDENKKNNETPNNAEVSDYETGEIINSERTKPRKSIMHNSVTLQNLKKNVEEDIINMCPEIKSLIEQPIFDEKLFTEKKNLELKMAPGGPKNVKPHILQICVLNQRACFFDNDLLKNRYVVSNEPTRVLLIPIYWLKYNNFADIWSRIERFMENLIPKKQELFKCYKEQQQWNQYRSEIGSQSTHYAYSTNIKSNIPYSLRLSK